MNQQISMPTIDFPQFINLEPLDINPLMSKCTIKVLYVGENRNGSLISKEVATNMSKTLRGCPIVGHYIKNKQDFGDHGDQVIIDENGVTINKLTKPYGFVAPDAKIWFQFYEDLDDYGNTQVREYLMTEGYLWTGQFKECADVAINENPQSMELDENSLRGYLDNDTKLFIINDATFSSLCILGQDVEPCFEGARFFSAESNEFMTELLYMAKELKFALESQKKEEDMEDNEKKVPTEFDGEGGGEAATGATVSTVTPPPAPVAVTPTVPAEVDGVTLSEEDKTIAQTLDESYAESGETKEQSLVKDAATNVDKKVETDFAEKEEVVEDSGDFESLQAEFAALQSKYNLLEEQNAELLAFKKEIEEKEKDELIASFYMLSDEDKKAVVENKANYSLKEIKAELSMICVDKKVNFSLDKGEESRNSNLTVNLNAHQADTLPAWLRAVQNFKEKIG